MPMPSWAAAVDAAMAPYARVAEPGASVLVVDCGRARHFSYGLADVEAGRPITPETSFRLASLSKQFTAAAVMLLAADGSLAYDDRVGQLVAGLPAWARDVTLRQLLHHTSGLPDYEDFVPADAPAQVHDRDIPGLIARAPGTTFPPGTSYGYSNTGYVLLALAVERVTGHRFADVLRDRIFAPLGMSGTVAREEGRTTVPHRAWGYTVDGDGIRRTDQSPTSATLGDGGIYSSARDLATWAQALDRYAIMNDAAQRLAWTPAALPDGRSTGYGFGWFVDRPRGSVRLMHHGETMGFTNGIVRYPERRLTVAILTNRTGGAPWELALHIAEACASSELT